MSPWIKVFWVLATADLLIWWVLWRTVARPPHRWKWASLSLHLFFAIMITTLGIMMLGRTHHWNVDVLVPRFITVAVFLWHFIVVPLALIGIIIAAIISAIGMLIRLFRTRQNTTPPTGLTRREFVARLTALTPPALTVVLSIIAEQQLKGFRIRRITVPLATLPAALDGLTIALVADSHVGRFTHGEILDRIATATNALNADLVLFAGDLINDTLAWLDDGIAMLKKIPGPLVVIEGNHDLFEDADEFRSRVKASGLNLLVNETATLTIRGVPVQILGMEWGTDSHRPSRASEPQLADSAARLLKLRDLAAFPILMAHHPHAWDYVSGIPLTISGHTHGGQLMLTDHLGAGPLLFRYWSGLYTRKAATPSDGSEALIVSNGIGNWFPLRVNAPAEIGFLTLQRESS